MSIENIVSVNPEALQQFIVLTVEEHIKQPKLFGGSTFATEIHECPKVHDALKAFIDNNVYGTRSFTNAVEGCINYSELAENLELSEVASYVRMSQLASEIDLDELAGKIDVSDIAERLSFSDIANEIQISDLATEIDVEAIAEHIDYKQLAKAIIAELAAKPSPSA